MFYTYVDQLPMVTDNLILIQGHRLHFNCGHIRKAKADQDGFRAYILYDRLRDVSYRVTKEGLWVEYGEKFGYDSVFVESTREELKYTPFAVSGEASEVNSFLVLIDRMVTENKRRRSIINRFRYFMKDPVSKVIIAAGVVYAIATVLVLVFG